MLKTNKTLRPKINKWLAVILINFVIFIAIGIGLAIIYSGDDYHRGFIEIIGTNFNIQWIMLSIYAFVFYRIGERFITIRRAKICPPDLVKKLEATINNSDYEKTMTLVEEHPNFLTNLLAQALPNVDNRFGRAYHMMQVTAEIEMVKIQRKISYFLILGVGALLLIIPGIMAEFIIALSERGRGILSAIFYSSITTAMGFFGAIIALGAYWYFKNKAARLIAEARVKAVELLALTQKPR